jgi:hypothetical protein
MSNEFMVVYDNSSLVTGALRDSTGKVLLPSTGTLETWGTGSRDITDYGTALTAKGGDLHAGNFPALTPVGTYTVQYFDGSYCFAQKGRQYWNGTSVVTLDDAIAPGDHAITITIRTTAGVALAGVKVWVNTANDRTGSIVQYQYTNSSGQVVFYLDYSIAYYVFCNLSRYSFTATSITPTSTTTTFTEDIGTAISTSTSSDYEDSFLSRALAEVRLLTDEPSTNAKYTDAQIITKIEQSYMMVLAEHNRNAQEPAVAKFTITVDAATADYALPPTIGAIKAIYREDANGLVCFYESRSRQNPYGRNVWVEGNTLHLQAAGYLDTGVVLTVEYLPDGTASLHNGTCTLNAGGTVATLGATPYAGALDTRENAYAGCTFRIFKVTGTGATGNFVQECKITEYDRTTRQATLDVALSPVPTAGSGGGIFYEIAPAIHKGLDAVIPAGAAYIICSNEGMAKRASSIMANYRQQMRNVRLQAYYSNLMMAAKGRGDTFRNSKYYSGRFRTI